ncbi:tRNA (adenosine(37)-N6)-threonylcarbamoyltransferase complex dimerization subunit type 1 TsaB [soil metagenome]
MSILLALDSSTDVMALALVGPGGMAFHESAGGAQASERLVPEAMALLARAGLQLSDLDAIAFGRGPGAFTGLRTACAVVQGLAFGAAKPVLSIDSLMLVAEDARLQALAEAAPLDGPIWVAMDARIGEIYAAAYRFDATGWITLDAPALYSPAALIVRWQSPQAVAGSALSVFADQLGQPPRSWPATVSRARALAALAEAAWLRGEVLDAGDALPVYVRDKVAQTTAERAAARAVAG